MAMTPGTRVGPYEVTTLICTLHDVGPDYLVMEFVDGVPMSGPLPMTEALRYAEQIADALDHAHRPAS
jgi:eukaryotic-like serine/threonine-protein kinase